MGSACVRSACVRSAVCGECVCEECSVWGVQCVRSACDLQLLQQMATTTERFKATESCSHSLLWVGLLSSGVSGERVCPKPLSSFWRLQKIPNLSSLVAANLQPLPLSSLSIPLVCPSAQISSS